MAQDEIATVLLAGQYQNGKSTLINCLLGGEYAIEGDGRHTTAFQTKYTYSPEGARYYKINSCGRRTLLKDGVSMTTDRTSGDVQFQAEIPSPILKRMSLIDAPGWGAEDADDRQAEQALQGADFVIYLVRAKQLSQEDKNFLRLLKKHEKYFCVVLNVQDKTDPRDVPQDATIQNLCSAIAGTLKQIGIDNQYIQYPTKSGLCVVNLLWAKYGKHLLDSPKTLHEKVQAATMHSVRDGSDADSETMDYAEILEASGFSLWCEFLDMSLRLVGSFASPVTTEIHQVIATSICTNLIKVLKRR